MVYAWPLAALALANLVGIISPGPAFLMVTRAAAGRSRGAALGLSLGVAMAAATWAAMACFGIALLMAHFAPAYRAIQLAGGLYLIWLGIGAWRTPHPQAQTTTAPQDRHRGIVRSVLVGAGLSLGNPKIVIFFTSIFATLLPAHAPLWVRITAIAIVGLQEVLWYSMVAFLFSRPRVQAAYRRIGTWVERGVGTMLIGFGARILTTVRV